MNRLLLVALACSLLLAGCVSSPDPTPGTDPGGAATPTPTATPTVGDATTAVPTTTDGSMPTGTATPPQENVTVEYVVEAGSIPDEFESLTVHLEVVFAERDGDLRECRGTLLASRYDPTPTPLPTPVDECRSFGGLTVDLTEINGTHSLGNFTVPGRFGTEHALVVRDVVPTYENGTRVERIHDTDFAGAVGSGAGRLGIRISVEAAPSDKSWRYSVSSEEFVPAE